MHPNHLKARRQTRMNKAPSSPKTAKTRRPTSATGTVRGVLLQVTRFLYYLLTVGHNDVVSLELFEDVGVEQQGGSKIAEQDKTYLSANPLADRSIEFWKTFRNWVDAAAAGVLAPAQSWFVLYAPSAQMGKIVKAFHNAKTDQAANDALEMAQQVLSGDDGLEIGASAREHVEAVFCADPTLVVGIIKRFTVDGDQHPADALRPLFHDKLVGEDSFDDVVTWAQGWVKQTIDHFVEQGQPARVVKQDFHQALLNYVRLHDRTNILRSVAGTATDQEVETELAERDYVSQLRIIDLDDVDVLEAVNDFLSASVDRTTWSDHGMISEASLKRLERELTSTWRNKQRRTRLGHGDKNAPDQGQLTYTDCMEHDATMDGLETPKPFIRGSWHALADDLTIGWHPNYRTVLAARKSTD